MFLKESVADRHSGLTQPDDEFKPFLDELEIASAIYSHALCAAPSSRVAARAVREKAIEFSIYRHELLTTLDQDGLSQDYAFSGMVNLQNPAEADLLHSTLLKTDLNFSTFIKGAIDNLRDNGKTASRNLLLKLIRRVGDAGFLLPAVQAGDALQS